MQHAPATVSSPRVAGPDAHALCDLLLARYDTALLPGRFFCAPEYVRIGLGIDPATFNPSSDPEATTNLPGSLAGNPDLQEETAKSWTAGFVLRPAALPDLMLSFDWYNVKLKNAVATATAPRTFK
jgi:outer membrane receptor protein involved in Fe transport